MNKDQNYWRIELAKYLFKRIDTLDCISTVFIGGSVCRGYADEYSDLEICFVWKKQIEEQDIILINKTFNVVSFDRRYKKNSFIQIEDSVYLNDFQIDIYHIYIGEINKIIDDVLYSYDINLEKMNYLNVLKNSIPLYGYEINSEWKQKINQYPAKLAELIISTHIKNFFRADGRLFIYREDWAIFYNLIAGYQKLIFLVLTGINHIYFPLFKNMNKTIERMDIKPENTIALYKNIYTFSPVEIWNNIVDLKINTLKLVETYYPNISTSQIYKQKSYMRRKHAHPPVVLI
ncbi:MAG: hypothetical protein R3E32_24995 [Chitinophagales bacterium]